jgi:hypothetical protein
MYTLSDLTRLTGAKRRSVQLWAEGGAIRAEEGTERQGSGIHRTFDRDEAIIACILAPFAETGAPIGRLIRIANGLRDVMLKNPGPRKVIDAAISDSRPVFLSIPSSHGDVGHLMDNPAPDDCYDLIFRQMNEAYPAVEIVSLNGCLAKLRFFG